jgi:hypothetical protein
MARQQQQQKHPAPEERGSRATVGGVPLRGVRKKSTTKNSVELVVSPSDKRFRGKVLASVGLDDDDDDDESYDKCEDIEESKSQHHRLGRNKSSRNNKRRTCDNSTKITKSRDVSEDIELLDDDDDEEDDDCEYESFDQSNNNSKSTTRFSTLKPICNKILWIMLTIAAVIFIFYDDEKLEESEIDEDAIQKQQQPYSYNGYKDARIPTDDLAQFGGGLLYNNGDGSGHSSQDDDDNNENTDELQTTSHHHDPTGIVEVDILWEQLDGYAEISEPLEEHDLPVFWHIREYQMMVCCDLHYTLCILLFNVFLNKLNIHVLSQYISIHSQMWRNDITRHDGTLLWYDRGKRSW